MLVCCVHVCALYAMRALFVLLRCWLRDSDAMCAVIRVICSLCDAHVYVMLYVMLMLLTCSDWCDRECVL